MSGPQFFSSARSVLIVLIWASLSWGQSTHQPPSVKAMKQRFSQVNVNVSSACAQPAGSAQVLTLLVRWNAFQSSRPLITPGSASPTPGGGFSVLQSKLEEGTVVLPKSAELSTDQLVVAAVNPQNRLCGWAVVSDPRSVRAEEPTSDQTLKGHFLQRTATTFLVSLPNAPDASRLRFYQPQWTGASFQLLPLGSATLPGRQ